MRSALLNVMVQAATKAGRSLAKDFGEVENLQVSVKGPADFVSNADKRAEEIVFNELQKARPTYSFLGEEGTEVKGSDGQHRWIVDPLDGTTNFLHGIPMFAVAIALERGEEIVASVIYNPVMDELFTAEKGGGAWLNDRRRLRVATRKHLADAVIVTGINSQGRALDLLQLKQLAQVTPAVAGIRGRGLMVGLALTGVEAAPVARRALELGVVVNAPNPETIRLLPPLTISADELGEGLSRLRAALAAG